MDPKMNELVLQMLRQQEEPVDLKTLAVLCGDPDKTSFGNALSFLEKRGEIVVSRKTVGLPEVMGCVTAVVTRAAKGFSFARPEHGMTEDLFLHASSSKGALPGDRVLIRHVQESDKGFSGEVSKILERGPRVITGSVERSSEKKGRAFLVPDASFSYTLPIVPGGELKSRWGDKVKASVYYDEKERRVYARVIKIYGRSDSARICADAIIDSYHIPVAFPVPVKHEAALAAASVIGPKEMEGREDLTNEPIFTIDGADAKDLDDAISVRRLPTGWELGVHIADVSHYVTKGSKLDEEAQQRGTSVYFADRVIPMLPVEISNGCCSLNEGTKKLTFSAIMRLDAKGALVDYRFVKSVIISKVRGVYSEVNQLLDGTAGEELKEKYAPVLEELSEAQALAQVLKKASHQRGELEIESDELRFVLDENGVCIGVSPRERGEAEELIEQFMIKANEAAALYAKSAGIPFVYRVHESPDPEKLHSLAELASSCGLNSRRITEGVHQTDLAALIEQASSTPYARLISTEVLRTMAKARYDARPLGHFGLSLSDYCHFTSPIRRYPDTSIHRILTDLVSGVPVDVIKSRYEEFASFSAKLSSEFELRAVKAERDTEKCYAAEYMSRFIGEQYTGVVSGVTNRGIFVLLSNGIEGFVDLLSAEGSCFEYDGKVTTVDSLTGKKFAIGDAVCIEMASANISAGQIDFVLAEPKQEEA